MSVLVVFIHASSFGQYNIADCSPVLAGAIEFMDVLLRKSFVLVAVPLFFIMSGATFFRNYSNDKYLIKLKLRLKSLAIPYIIWNILGMFFAIGISYTFISKFLVGREKFVLSFKNIFLSIFHNECNGPFWFIFALICFIIISPLIDLIIRNRYIGLVVIGLFIILQFWHIGIPAWFIYEPNSIIFYLIGCWIGKHNFKMFSEKVAFSKAILSLIIFILDAVYFILIGLGVLDSTYAIRTIMLAIGAISFWFAFDIILCHIKTREYFKNSFLIYAMHINILEVIIKLIYLILPNFAWMSIINFFAATSLTVVSICVFAFLVNKYMPRVYMIISGNR